MRDVVCSFDGEKDGRGGGRKSCSFLIYISSPSPLPRCAAQSDTFLGQHKPLGPPIPPAGSSAAAKDSTSSGTDTAAASQLEAVKFLCKEFWTEVFRKQIDKLQTNHRGVFVLKDHELRWLRRLPPEDETARVAAIKMLAFPCGLIRGALGNLGIAAVVSCDFLADGKNMAACSFNIKVKS